MKPALLNKFRLSILLTLIIGLFSLSFFIGKAYAEDVQPIPKARLPCEKVDNPEFNSLRPYQAAPCADYTPAFFCGNQVNIVEDHTVRQKGEHACIRRTWKVNTNYWIDLSEVSLPILGNTELVQNSQNTTDLIDDATKMNEYVSWYLNGTNNKAEYGEIKNTGDTIINYSGPIQKLLPGAIADAQRIASIASSSAIGINTTDEDEQDIPQNGPLTHNQIVVCATKEISIPLFITNFFHLPSIGIGRSVPVPCYPNQGSRAQGDVYRLSNNNKTGGAFNWEGSSTFQDILNWFHDQISILVPDNSLAQALLDSTDRWPYKIPPLPWGNNQDGEPFATYEDYQKAYNEWRGQLCTFIELPITGRKLICVGAWPWVNNPYADLFQYIPMASTPDKLGKMPIFTTLIQPSSGTNISFKTWNKLAAPSLYYAHTQEVKDLSVSLNDTFTPKGLDTSSIPASSEINNDKSDPVCRVVDVRSNPGDNLFPIKQKADIGVHVEFTVDEFCNCSVDYDEFGNPTTTCHGQVNIGIQTDPNKQPYLDDIWNTTVSGNASTFRRIYPKVEEGAPVSCIEDNPGVSRAVYKPVEGTNKIGVEGPLKSVDSQNMDPENAQIYFSHLGSVYDYFLKGIQTALRPKGFGDPTPQSGVLCSTLQEDGDCSWNIQKINQAMSSAAAKYNVPSSLLNAIFQIESYEIINGDPKTYSCTPNTVGALGVAQITQQTYDEVTCDNEKMSDIKMCGDYGQKLSRCNFNDAFELMARILLYKAGRFAACQAPNQGISESEVQVWYKAACNYYGSFAPDQLTVGLQNDIPPDQRRQDGDMNYCDIVGYKMGAFPPYPAR